MGALCGSFLIYAAMQRHNSQYVYIRSSGSTSTKHVKKRKYIQNIAYHLEIKVMAMDASGLGLAGSRGPVSFNGHFHL